MEPLLELRDIHYAYHSTGGETQALSNISFSVNDGEFIAIVGPSGCGNPMVQPWKHFPAAADIFPFSAITGCRKQKYGRSLHPRRLYPV